MRALIAFYVIALTAGAVEGGNLWVNNISVNEYGMTWMYDETFTGMDSIAYRMNIDTGFGDNDSFVNAWEVLRADKEMRKEFRSQIDKEPDVKINNETYGVEVVDVDAAMSPDLIGKTHLFDPIVNKYITVYRWKDSILNASSIWFLGQANSSVTIVMPQGVDIVNISGMDNGTLRVIDHAEISGTFKAMTKDRGEITLALAKNSSFLRPEVNVSNVTLPVQTSGSSKPMFEILGWIRNASIVLIGVILVLMIYVIKVKRR